MSRVIYFLVFIISFIGCSDSNQVASVADSKKKSPHDFMFMQRAYPVGEIKSDAFSNALNWKKQNRQQGGGNGVWEFAGPLNVGGRITDIEIPSSQAQTYYIGAASGGVFKTEDAGVTWNPIFDEQEMLSIGDIEISKTNNDVVWVGTGEVNAGGGSLAYDGNGVFLSSDGGITWESKGLETVGSVGKILISPDSDDVVYVGAMGPLFKNDSQRGVYKSTDGGSNWDKVLHVSDSTGIIDMAIHPQNPNIVYAASWERIRRPNRRQYGGITSNIYRSVDAGSTWEILTNGLPSVPSAKGRISIDISQSNPNVLYALYADAQGSIEGVFKTENGGDSWVSLGTNGLTDVGFHWWFGGVFIDPTNENTIYNVGFSIQKSTNGGQSWSSAFGNVHVDQHALAFNASVPGEILLGNDGGLYKSTNDGVSSVKNLNLPITQFYRFHVDAQNVDKVYGGTQDNNTIRTTNGGLSNWQAIFGGDGFQPLVDPTNTAVIYALSQRGNLGKSINDGVSFSSALNGIPSADPNNWDTPIAFDPQNPQILYYGTNKVYKTANGATNWSVISPDLSNGPHSGNLAFGTITSISVSPIDSDIIYAGTDDGNVWRSEDGGNFWENLSDALPNRWVTKVLASREEVNTVYVTYSGYRYGTQEGHVYKSIDAGINWNSIGTSLPDIPINDIEQDIYGNLFIGTDIGVLASNTEGAAWEVLGTNLPSVVVTDIFIHEDTETLFIGTYGRSSYKMDIANDILDIPSSDFSTSLKIYPNPTAEKLHITSVKNGISSLVVYDALGRKVLENYYENNKKTQAEVSLAHLFNGVYVVAIEDGLNNKLSKQVIVKH